MAATRGDTAAVGADQLHAPGLHGQRLAVAMPLVDEVETQHDKGQGLAHVFDQRCVAGLGDDLKNQERQEQHGKAEQGFVHHRNQTAFDGRII
jgi:hypothetical protein